MPVPFIVDSLDKVPEATRSLYVPQGDKFVLDVDGAVPKTKLDEFRNNNVELLKQLDKFKDVDPVKYKELQGIQAQLDEKKLIDAGKIDEVVNQRVDAMKRDYDGKLTAAENDKKVMSRQLETLLIDNTVRAEAVKNGVLATAVDDVLLRAKAVFTIKDGQPVALDAKGQVVYGKDGTTPMSIGDWLVELKQNAVHLFPGSVGAGSRGSGGRGGESTAGMSATGKISAGLSSR